MKLFVHSTEFSMKITQKSLIFSLFWRLFVVTGIIYEVFIFDIISVRFPIIRHSLTEFKVI